MPLTVLIVEDHVDGAESLAQLLALYGHEVRTAGSGAEALALWERAPAEVVILDVGLPGDDGYAVAKNLCAVAKRRPLLPMRTGYPNLDARSHDEGFDHHFLKPVDPCALARLLRTYAARVSRLRGPGQGAAHFNSVAARTRARIP